MAPRQGARDGQPLRRSTRKKAATQEFTLDDTGMISRSPTPSFSRGASPIRQDENAPEPTEGQVEEDMFMRSTQEVAAVALASMKSGGDNRGHEVCSAVWSQVIKSSIFDSECHLSEQSRQQERKVRDCPLLIALTTNTDLLC